MLFIRILYVFSIYFNELETRYFQNILKFAENIINSITYKPNLNYILSGIPGVRQIMLPTEWQNSLQLPISFTLNIKKPNDYRYLTYFL